MLSYIDGTVAEVAEDKIVLDHRGIGYEIYMPALDLLKLMPSAELLRIYVYLQVSENGIGLYGFLSAEEKQLFIMLLSVSGVGPKAAVAVCGTLSPKELRLAVLADDDKAISKAPGVGPKSAKRIVLELKDKFQDSLPEDSWAPSSSDSASGGRGSDQNEALLALTALGYSASEALSALNEAQIDDSMNVSQMIRAALKELSTF